MVLSIKNRSDRKEYEVTVILRVETVLYTGRVGDPVKRWSVERVVRPGAVEEARMEVSWQEYGPRLLDQCAFNVACLATVKDTNFEYFAQDDFRVRKPDIAITVSTLGTRSGKGLHLLRFGAIFVAGERGGSGERVEGDGEIPESVTDPVEQGPIPNRGAGFGRAVEGEIVGSGENGGVRRVFVLHGAEIRGTRHDCGQILLQGARGRGRFRQFYGETERRLNASPFLFFHNL